MKSFGCRRHLQFTRRQPNTSLYFRDNGGIDLLRNTVTDHSASARLQCPSMSESEFRFFSQLIHDHCGIKMPPIKKTMLTSRLLRRLRALGIDSFGQYCEYISSEKAGEQELVHMIDAVTTNKTEFFREPWHFEFLHNEALPALTRSGRRTGSARLKIWSAGCSTGEEPYTLAMVLAEYFAYRPPGDFHILASDISTRALTVAERAIYPKEAVTPIPQHLMYNYLMRGTGSRNGHCRLVPEIRNRVTFRRINLVEGEFDIDVPMDIIFCRNVIIYFNRETQVRLFDKFYRQLAPGGYMFIGHSETLHGIDSRFAPVAVSAYQKQS